MGFQAASLALLPGGAALTCPHADSSVTLLCSCARLVGWVRLTGDVSAFPRALSFLYIKKKFFFFAFSMQNFPPSALPLAEYLLKISLFLSNSRNFLGLWEPPSRAADAHKGLPSLQAPGCPCARQADVVRPKSHISPPLNQSGALGSLH